MKPRTALAALAAFLAPTLLVALLGALRVARGALDVHAPAPLTPGAPKDFAPDDARPLAVVLAGPTGAQVTDLAASYAVLVASGAFRVATVAPQRVAVPLWPGLELMPDLSFAELDERAPEGPAVVVVPNVRDPEDPELVAWLAEAAARGPIVASISEGARCVAAAGLGDGRQMTSHFLALKGLAKRYPRVRWVRGARTVWDGELLSSAGVTAAFDAGLALVERVAGVEAAERTAGELGYELPAAGSTPARLTALEGAGFAAHALFTLDREPLGVLVREGVDELEVAALLDVYGRSVTHRAWAVAQERAVVRSRRGLALVPVYGAATAPELARLLVPHVRSAGGVDAEALAIAAVLDTTAAPFAAGSPGRAIEAALNALAEHHSPALARAVAETIESPLARRELGSASWPLWTWLRALLPGALGVLAWLGLRHLWRPKKDLPRIGG